MTQLPASINRLLDRQQGAKPAGESLRPQAELRKAVFIFAPIMLIAVMVATVIIYTSKQTESRAIRFAQQHTVDMQAAGISHDIIDISANLQIIVNSGNVRGLWDESGNLVQQAIDQLTSEFVNIASYYGSFNQVRLIDAQGMEAVRVNHVGGVTEVVKPADLQNKKGRYYFEDALRLQRGQVFVSPLDLNVEHGKIERPLKPMIRFASPVFDSWGNKRGIVLLNYFGAELISRFADHQSTFAGSQAMLLNSDGYWLKGPVPEDEWGFMYPERSQRIFAASYADAWTKISSGLEAQFETDAGLFTFKTVHPLLEGQVSHTNRDHVIRSGRQAQLDGDYSWKIVSYVPKEVLYAAHYHRYQMSAWMLGVFAVAVFIASLRVAGFSIREKMVEQKLLVHYSALNAAGDAVLITDEDGKIEWINKALSKMTGYLSEDLTSRHFSRLLDFESNARNEIEEAITQKKDWQGELIYIHQNRDQVSADTSLTPVFNDSGEVKNFIAIMRDLSEKKALETQLLAAQKMESVGQLAAGIAHEINTPTQFVGDNVHFLKDVIDDSLSVFESLQKLQQQLASGAMSVQQVLPLIGELLQQVDLEYIRQEAPQAIDQSLEGLSRIAKIVSAMKDFSHPGGGGMEDTDLNHVIETTVTIARNEWKYVADLHTELEENLPSILADSQSLGQTILNFIVNASHAIAERYPQGEQKGLISISTRSFGDRVELRIADNGTGIRDAIRQRIFEPFFTTKQVGKGSGQGLAIAYSAIVDKHNGEIELESTLGEGSTFIITLPIHHTSAKRPDPE